MGLIRPLAAVLVVLVLLGVSWMFLGLLATTLFVLAAVFGLLSGFMSTVLATGAGKFGERVAGLLEAGAAATLYRPSITFAESTDLLLRRRIWDAERGAEILPTGEDEIEIADPGDAIWSWHGQPLNVVDEVFGLAFDPRHMAVGEVLRKHRQRGELYVGDLTKWRLNQGTVAVPGYAKIPREATRFALDAARELVWGAEEGDHPHTAIEFFKKSQEGRISKSVSRQLLLPLGALVLGFGLMWFAAKYGPGGGGGGGSTIVNWGSTLPFVLSLRPWGGDA